MKCRPLMTTLRFEPIASQIQKVVPLFALLPPDSVEPMRRQHDNPAPDAPPLPANVREFAAH